MSLAEVRDRVLALKPCDGAQKWIKSLRGTSARPAWARCKRGDWLLWLVAMLGVDRRTVVLTASACARLALVHVPASEDKPRMAIETAEAWARGEASFNGALHAAYCADCVADAAIYDARAAAGVRAAYAAYAAAYAARAAASAARTAVYAGYATDTAVYAADSAAYGAHTTIALGGRRASSSTDAYDGTLRQCAEIVRTRISWDVVEAAMREEDDDG